jgi:uncharacterized membrane protein (UPF0127 family)
MIMEHTRWKIPSDRRHQILFWGFFMVAVSAMGFFAGSRLPFIPHASEEKPVAIMDQGTETLTRRTVVVHPDDFLDHPETDGLYDDPPVRENRLPGSEDLSDQQSGTIYLETALSRVPIVAEYAKTDEEHQLGLMYRSGLADGHGMLFVYDEPVETAFWMKNMHFPIDILYFDENAVLRLIWNAVSPCGDQKVCPTYPSRFPVRYVLELPVGSAQKYHLQPGDRITF